MEDSKTFITDICENILDNYFTQFDSLSELINPNPIRATRIIVNKIRRIIDEFEVYCPMIASSKITTDTEGYYTFIDNYKDVVEGKESPENLELIPLTIAKVGGNSFAYSGRLAATANYWTYNRGTLHSYAKSCSQIIDAVYHYPLYIQYTEDGYLNKFSHIYGLERMQKDMLYNLMELRFLELIKNNENRIKLPTTIDFFNLDNDIQLLEKRVEEDRTSCSALRIGWK